MTQRDSRVRYAELENITILRDRSLGAGHSDPILNSAYVDLACDQRLTDTAVRLYVLLAAWDDQDIHHPTLGRLAMKLGINRGSVSRGMNLLVECGWVLKMPETHGGRYLGTRYALRNGYRPPEDDVDDDNDLEYNVAREQHHNDVINLASHITPAAEVPVLVTTKVTGEGTGVLPVPVTPEGNEVPGSFNLDHTSKPNSGGEGGVGGGTAIQHSTPPKVAVKPPKAGYVSPVVPAELVFFNETLLPLPGYFPTERFFTRLLAEFTVVSLDTEAVKMADWVTRNNNRRQHRDCSVLFILNWLRTATRREASPLPFSHSQHGLRGPGGRQENGTVEYAVQAILAGEEITQDDVADGLWPLITAEVERRRCQNPRR